MHFNEGPMPKLIRPKITDTFIREVNIQYRTIAVKQLRINQAYQAADFIRTILVDNSREQCVVLYLDALCQVTCYSIVSIGDANFAPVSPREVFQRAVMVGAVSLILAHNHPSGNLFPSQSDHNITDVIDKAGKILDIKLLDHIIVTDTGYFSIGHERSTTKRSVHPTSINQ